MIGASTRPSGRTPVCSAARTWASVQAPSPVSFVGREVGTVEDAEAGQFEADIRAAEIARHVGLGRRK